MNQINQEKKSYRPDIDGLRALAVLLVIAFHTAPSRLPSGFIGVDIFFVISGYLITGILISDFAAGNLSLQRFYARRIRRLFPALIVVLVSCILAGWWILLPLEYANIGQHVTAASVFLSNILLWTEAGYFDLDSTFKPLVHLWSLGVEEQFYLIWPVILIFVYKKLRKPLAILAFLTLLSLGSALSLAEPFPDAIFYNPATRFWELWIGGLLALFEKQENDWANIFIAKLGEILAILGVVLIGIGVLFINQYTQSPGPMTLLPVLGTALIIATSSKSTIISKVLSNRLAVLIGLISYPLYLWHWPILSFARIIEPHLLITTRAGLVAIAFLLAWLTYRYIEIPIRKKNTSFVLPLTFVVILIGLIGLSIYRTPDLQETRLAKYVNEQALAAVSDTYFPGGLIKRTDLKKRFVDDIRLNVNYHANSNRNPTVLLFGDSQMEHYSSRISKLTTQGRAQDVLLVSCGGCSPLIGSMLSDDIELVLAHFDSIKKVVVAADWLRVLLNPDDLYTFDPSTFKLNSHNKEAYDNLYATVKKLSEKFPVFVILTSPRGPRFDPSEKLTIIDRTRLTFRTSSIDMTSTIIEENSFPLDQGLVDFNKIIENMVLAAGGTPISSAETICPNRICSAVDSSNRYIYIDAHHMRPFFAKENILFLDNLILR